MKLLVIPVPDDFDTDLVYSALDGGTTKDLYVYTNCDTLPEYSYQNHAWESTSNGTTFGELYLPKKITEHPVPKLSLIKALQVEVPGITYKEYVEHWHL